MSVASQGSSTPSGNLQVAASSVADIPEEGRHYDSLRRFSIRFPAGWEIRENELGAAVIAISPATGRRDLRENILIFVEMQDYDVSLSDYVAVCLDNMRKTIPNFRPIQQEAISINGVPATRLLYTGTESSGYTAKNYSYMVVEGRLCLSITCYAWANSFADYRVYFETALATLRVQ